MKRIFLLSLGVLLLAACKVKPVHNVEDEPFPQAISGQSLTMQQVEKAIISAALKRGWSTKAIRPGLIEAKIAIRQHSATVNIEYSKSAYSIRYVDSTNLHYEDGKIHRNYNNWIVHLTRDIKAELWNEVNR